LSHHRSARARLIDLIATQDFMIMTMASVKTQVLGLDRGLITACFGEGTILAFEGSGPQMKVQVRFDDGSKKWLVLQYAKLVPLG
jgi:hypothetical protein